MKYIVGSIVLALGLAGCGGSSGSSAVPSVAAAPSSSPTTPSGAPTGAPTTAPSSAPSTAPTTKPAGNHIAAAPAQVFTSSGLRKPQSVNLGSGGVPTVVVGFNTTMGGTFSQLYVWAANASNQPVAEASMTATPLGALTLQTSVLDNANLFAATYHDWIISPQTLSGVGKISIIVAFADGTTGTIPYYSYDKWNLNCSGVGTPGSPSSWAYVSGVPKGQVLPQDVIMDCAHNTLVFANGATLLAAPVADAYGNTASAFTTTLSGTWDGSVTTVPLGNVPVGAIYLFKTSDGGFAKFMVYDNEFIATGGGIAFLSGFSLHGSGNTSTFAF